MMSLSEVGERRQFGGGSDPASEEYRPRRTWAEMARNLAVLFKARIVGLLLLAATGGAFLGAGGWPG
ncbi:MAG: hypothetical protein AB1791_11230, partial [Chloroflexota bacterium]